MIFIELKDVRMHAYHGFYEGEQEQGSPYELNLQVGFDHNERPEFGSVNDTLDYTVLYELIHQRMMVPTPLLETVAESIVRRIKHHYPQILEIHFSIYKLQPPIPGFTGKVGVSLRKVYNA